MPSMMPTHVFWKMFIEQFKEAPLAFLLPQCERMTLCDNSASNIDLSCGEITTQSEPVMARFGQRFSVSFSLLGSSQRRWRL